MRSDSAKHWSFSEEEVANIVEYGNALRSIRARLLAEGYFLPCGKVWNIFKCVTPIGELELEEPYEVK